MRQSTLHLCLLLVVLLGLESGASQEEKGRVFHNEWAVEIEGGERIARDVAEENGFTFVKKVGLFKRLVSNTSVMDCEFLLVENQSCDVLQRRING